MGSDYDRNLSNMAYKIAVHLLAHLDWSRLVGRYAGNGPDCIILYPVFKVKELFSVSHSPLTSALENLQSCALPLEEPLFQSPCIKTSFTFKI